MKSGSKEQYLYYKVNNHPLNPETFGLLTAKPSPSLDIVTAQHIQMEAPEIYSFRHFVSGENTIIARSKTASTTKYGLQTVMRKHIWLKYIHDNVISNLLP